MTNLTEFSINENSRQATIVDDGKIIKIETYLQHQIHSLLDGNLIIFLLTKFKLIEMMGVIYLNFLGVMMSSMKYKV